jgi:hypothetical protein
MTERSLYDYALIEMNKVEAPSLILEDYNYYINKAVQQYINKVYNRYDINQQSADDLRVLKATTKLNVTKETQSGYAAANQKFVYTANLPSDYMHILNCIVEFKVKKNFKCYMANDHVDFAAKRLTADMAAGILHNVYMKPSYKRPYFYINNISEFDGRNEAFVDNKTFNREVTDSVKDKDTRLSNPSNVRIEIRYGDDTDIFEPECIYVDYIKSPMFIRLTYQDITNDEDHTRPLEFPDYVCYEIVNEFVKLLMENASDPRIQTNYAVNQSIGDPTVQQKS